jgi:hypothetical protein
MPETRKTLIVRTVQLAQWRKVPGHELINVTVMSGDKTFAPTWDMVKGYKQGFMSEETYIKLYTHHMAKSQHYNEERWLQVLNMGAVTFGCYCPATAKFCHRRLLVDCFMAFGDLHGVDVTYEGEVR